jgi:hypothetical protein
MGRWRITSYLAEGQTYRVLVVVVVVVIFVIITDSSFKSCNLATL